MSKVTKLSCVRKNTWQYYTTCNECELKKTCTHEMNDGWFGRLYESVIVWWYRMRVRKRLNRMFEGVSHRQVKNASYAQKRLKKQQNNENRKK